MKMKAASFVGVLGALALVLEISVRLGVFNRIFFPPPSAVFITLSELFRSSDFWMATGATVVGMIVGFGGAVLIAVPVGAAMGHWSKARLLFEPIVDSLRPMPSAAVIPVAILVFGLGLQMKMAVIIFGSVWPIIINTMDGIRGVDPLLVDTGRLLQLRRLDVLRRIILPAALPGVFTGLRISLGIALILTVTTEMIAGTSGLGYFILDAQRSFAFREMFAAIVALGLIGYGLTQAFAWIERRVLFWHVSVRSELPQSSGASGAETFSGLKATDSRARELRLSLNDRYLPDPKLSLHRTFAEELWPEVEDPPKRVLWVGMDVRSYVPQLASRWPRAAFVAAHWRPVALRELRTWADTGAGGAIVTIERWQPENGAPLAADKEGFDLIGCTYALHDLDPKSADVCVKRLGQLLRSGGRAYFATHAKGSFGELLDLYKEAARTCGFPKLSSAKFSEFNTFAQEDAADLLRNAFEEVRFREFDTSLRFQGSQGLDAFLEYASIFPFPGLEDLSPVDRDRLWLAFRDQAAKLPVLTVTKPSGIFVCCGRPVKRDGRSDPVPVAPFAAASVDGGRVQS